jgi:hypothetical protein
MVGPRYHETKEVLPTCESSDADFRGGSSAACRTGCARLNQQLARTRAPVCPPLPRPTCSARSRSHKSRRPGRRARQIALARTSGSRHALGCPRRGRAHRPSSACVQDVIARPTCARALQMYGVGRVRTYPATPGEVVRLEETLGCPVGTAVKSDRGTVVHQRRGSTPSAYDTRRRARGAPLCPIPRGRPGRIGPACAAAAGACPRSVTTQRCRTRGR